MFVFTLAWIDHKTKMIMTANFTSCNELAIKIKSICSLDAEACNYFAHNSFPKEEITGAIRVRRVLSNVTLTCIRCSR